MPEEKILNGVNINAVTDLIHNVKEKPDLGKSKFRVNNKWIKGGHNRTAITGFSAAGQEISHVQGFALDADEPAILAGGDQAPSPVEHLLNALAT